MKLCWHSCMADQAPPLYDIHPEHNAAAGNVVVIDSDSDDEDYEPAPWGVRCEASCSPRHVAVGVALVASMYMLNCIVFYCLH